MTALAYNERAWAVDVISAINRYADTRHLEIRRAGGEHTLKQYGENSLFPDVILFGDESATRVRHGWEMKFPNTPVDDMETIANARRKAVRLGVNSFVIWNVDRAQLHVADDVGIFQLMKTWGPIGAKKRSDVANLEAKWRHLLEKILEDLNGYFKSGRLVSASPSFLADTFFIDFLDDHTGLTAASLEAAANGDAGIEAEFAIWWASNPDSTQNGKLPRIDFRRLAQAVIVGWINRLLFCHYLKAFRKEAGAVETITGTMSVSKALTLFESISAQCDFMQVFRAEAGARAVPVETWQALKQLNAFMTDLAVSGINQQALRLALEGALDSSRRKAHGQYTTPDRLAELLVAIGMKDRSGALLDPCCGTGTIPKAALQAKVARGQTYGAALSSIWASDRFQFPLQFTTMALAEPEAMGTPLRVFRADVFSLAPGRPIDLTDPRDGSRLKVVLPPIKTIASNLPFVRFETLARFDPDLRQRFAAQACNLQVDAKSDLFAYIVLFLKNLLADDGRLCVIVSNAWLGTEWGLQLRQRLAGDFSIDTVVTSGAGKWFANADVVTNILLLTRKKMGNLPVSTRFVTTLRRVVDWDSAYIHDISTDIHGHSRSVDKPDQYRIRSYPESDLASISELLIGWPGFFADIAWIMDLKPDLVRVQTLMAIARGERRGCDRLFFPPPDHGIEANYIEPVLLNARDVAGLTAIADREAFCCSKTVAELKRLGHQGALNWVKRFESQVNENGKPLPEVLATSGRQWFEMRTDTTADFAIAMNPEDRIFTMRLNQRSFVNQRLIRLSVDKKTADLDLLHALLNTSLAVFFIESSGFGRGLGALDIQPTKLKAGFKLPDPKRIARRDRTAILAAFAPLLARKVLRLDHEMDSIDRHKLDEAVLSAIGKAHHGPAIRAAVVELYRIRKAVKT